MTGKMTFVQNTKMTAAQVNGFLMDQVVAAFADAAARDAAITAPAEGMLAQTLDDETFWRFDGDDWEVLLEPSTSWTPSVVQGGSVAATVDWAGVQRTYRGFRAVAKLTMTGSGVSGSAIGITMPFAGATGISGGFRYYDASLGIKRVGYIGAIDATYMGLEIDGALDLYGIAGSDVITADDVLEFNVQGFI